MHTTARRIVFYSLVALFVVGGAYAVAVALGLTFGTGGTVLRTGSLFIESIPRSANIFLDGAIIDERPSLLSGGTLVKGLSPRTYEVRVEYEGRHAWRAALPVREGIVTRATEVFLWPRAASSTPLARGVDSFRLSAGIPVVRRAGALSLEGVRLPGAELAYASNDAATLITRTDGTVYLVGRGLSGATLNLTALFHSLKERELGLPGTVPLVEVRPHPFSAGKFLITTETSLYALDTRRVSLERLVTVPRIVHAAWGDSEVLLLGEDGVLTAVDLVFKTAAAAPFSSSTLARLEATPDQDVLIFLTRDGTLSAHYRASDTRVTVAEGVTDFALGPFGDRLAYAQRNGVATYFLFSHAGDTVIPQGTVMPLAEESAPRALSWNSSLPRYLFFLAGDELIALEVGLHGERNRAVLAKNVSQYEFAGFTAHVLSTTGELAALSFEE